MDCRYQTIRFTTVQWLTVNGEWEIGAAEQNIWTNRVREWGEDMIYENRLCIWHIGPFEKVQYVTLLGEKQAFGVKLGLNAQEKIELA
jgi:hypothetical protein